MLTVLIAGWLAPTSAARGQSASVPPAVAATPATAGSARDTTSASTTSHSAAPATTAAAAVGTAVLSATTAPVSSNVANMNEEGANEDADWTQTVNNLAELLAGNDLVALQRTLRPTPVIRPFGSDALQTPGRLLGATTGATLLGVHAYSHPPTTLASDLANDFSSAGDEVPQNVRAGMVPPDGDAARRANETAGQWLVQVLQPREEDVTGVIVLWPATRGRAPAAAPKRATFVLLKAERVDGAYVIRQITFGDPLESPQ